MGSEGAADNPNAVMVVVEGQQPPGQPPAAAPQLGPALVTPPLGAPGLGVEPGRSASPEELPVLQLQETFAQGVVKQHADQQQHQAGQQQNGSVGEEEVEEEVATSFLQLLEELALPGVKGQPWEATKKDVGGRLTSDSRFLAVPADSARCAIPSCCFGGVLHTGGMAAASIWWARPELVCACRASASASSISTSTCLLTHY